jgi:spore coat protein U domain-containing protein, fimbrial subunit CupE1/2/3/6
MSIGRTQFAALLLLLFGWAGDADALTCTITMSDVAFGSINPLAGAVVDVSANATVNCSDLIFPLIDNTVGVCVYLDAGSGGTDGTTYRHMLQGAETLQYNLYKDAARTQIWGSETAFSSSGAQRIIVTLSGLLPSTGSTVVPVYGRIPAAISDRPTGSYLSTFTGGARARYSYTDTIACDGVAGTQATATFVVTGTILGTCTVEADDLVFGSNARLDAAVDATTQVRTSCSTGLPYAVSISDGGGSGFGARRMVHDSFPAEIVNYQLYRNALHTDIWGDGTGGTVTSSGTGNGSPQGATVYGRVPAQATPRPGDYHDTAIVTVTY